MERFVSSLLKSVSNKGYETKTPINNILKVFQNAFHVKRVTFEGEI